MTEAERQELEFLRFFYAEAAEAFGPADDDVYQSIKEAYEAKGGKVPDEYY